MVSIGHANPIDSEAGITTAQCSGPSQRLPRADGGKDAWLFLTGCFVFEAIVWGFPFSFGVFQSYYTSHPPFSQHTSGIAAVGTCSTGIMYLFAPISLYALEAWPSIRRQSSIFGLIIVISALVSSSFSTLVWHLILTQGILYAIGGSLLYSPTMFYLDEWFIEKKGLAFGIMWAGAGTSGVIFPFLLTFLLDTYGFRITLRIWSIILLLLCGPLIYFIKPRLPPNARTRQPVSYAFLKTRTFFFLQAGNILESLGFFLPSIYLPIYATSLHLPKVAPTLLLALLNSFSVIGAILLGYATDHIHVTLVITVSCIVSSLSIFLIWGLSTSFPALIIFAAIYGIFAGGFSATWAGMIKEVKKEDERAGLGTLMGMFSSGRGVGSVVSGPISEVLLKGSPWKGRVAGGYGTSHGAVIVFTGVSAICGIVGLGARKRRRA
ncbi:MFS monocarboxylate transporter-like protein [Bisporella sp. PMI_857]|nr:MFS monocarboxylate transporter-like protein [Bisporella sp. PMI_857]